MSNNVISTIPAFIGGVSQQSPALRLKTQCDSLVNGHATVGDGLMQRPNADLVKVIGSITAPTGMKIHKIFRDVSEKYIAVFTTDTTNPIRIFDLTGTEMTVRYGYYDSDDVWHTDTNKKQYLTNGGITDAKKQIKACSVADYTIVVNTKKTTAKSTSQTSAKNDAAYVWMKSAHHGDYTFTYHWKVSGTPYSQGYTIHNPYSEGVLNYNCTSLLENVVSNNPVSSNITLSKVNSVLKVVGTGTTDANSVSVTVEDPYGGHDLVPINWCEVDGSDKLPPQMPEDIIIKVGGDDDINQDDYYMFYDFDTTIWSETIGWDQYYELDADTLPYRLIRSAANQFDFCPIKYEDRIVGDDETNPMPSFIGQTIDNVVFAKNRFWYLSKENAIGSKAGDYFNYFSSTVMDVLDDDPIDVAHSGEQVVKFRSAKGFDDGLLLFSDEEQFALHSGDQLLTPKSVAIDATTAYPADPYADPIKLGADVYFVSPKGSYLSLRQYTIMPDTLKKDAYNVTSHVPNYIPQGDVMMAGCNSLDMLFVHSSADDNTLYTYKFLWNGDKMAQQAWYEWTFADSIYGFVVFGTVLYVLFYDSTNGYRLENINLENIPYSGQDMRYHIDSLMKLTGGSYSNPDTTFTLPMNVGDGSDWTVIDASDNSEVAQNFTLSGTTLTIQNEDASSKTYFVGRDYEMRMRFSQWYMRDSEGNALIAGNLTIRALTLSFTKTGYFKIEVTPFGRNMNYQEFDESMSGVKVDETVIGSVSLLTGEQDFLIAADSRQTIIELSTDSYLPVALQLGCWKGKFVYQGKIT